MPQAFATDILESWSASPELTIYSFTSPGDDYARSGDHVGERASELSGTDEIKQPSESLIATSSATAGRPLSLNEHFQELVSQWKTDSMFMSSPMDMVRLPSYLSIIAIGDRVIPLLFAELKRDIDHWFFALAFLTGENPVAESDAGDVEKMAATWLQWGQSHGYL